MKALNLFLQGWGNYFHPGNPPTKFIQLDLYVMCGSNACSSRSGAATCAPAKWSKWTSDWFYDQGLHQFMGSIRHPKAA